MSNLPEEFTVEGGKTLSLRELDPGDMLDLIEAGGSAMSGEAAHVWLNYAQMICSVRAINAVPIQMPTTKDEIKELARRIGTGGIAALQTLFLAEDEQDETMLDVAKN